MEGYIMGKWYINYRYENEPVETLEACDSYKEAKYLYKETCAAYRSCGCCRIWISKRATKDYYNSIKEYNKRVNNK